MPPPDLPDPPDNSTTTTPGWTPDFSGLPDATWIIIVGVVIVVVLAIAGYWYFRSRRERIKRLRLEDFKSKRFQAATRAFNAGAYNTRILYVVVPLGIGLFVPMLVAVWLNDPALAPLIMFAGLAISALLTILIGLFLMRAEERANMNKTWGDANIYYPGEGFMPATIRRMTPDGDPITLSEKQVNVLTERLTEQLWPHAQQTLDKITPDQFKKILKKRIGEMIFQKFVAVDNYRLLLALKHPWKDCENPYQSKMFDVMTYVDVNLAPLTMAHIDLNVHKIVQTMDDDQSITHVDRNMGVFVVLVDRVDMLTMIAKGNFDAPSAMDMFLSSLVHLYQQDAIYAETIETKERELQQERESHDKTKRDKDTRASRDFNNSMASADVLFGHGGKVQTATQVWAIISTMFLMFLLFFVFARG